jgi:hypothetical protein
MKRAYLVVVCVISILIGVFLPDAGAQKKRSGQPNVNAQNPAPPVEPGPLKCSPPATTGKERMTYRVGASSTTTAAELARIEETWGELVVPQGETERAKEIHRKAQAWLESRKAEFNLIYDQWLANTPTP